jgi:tetratricopeptide (TPR) repeat protein
MTSAFATADQLLGGGHARAALAAYLAGAVTVQPHPSAAERADRAYLGAAATLTQLIGFMCFDSLHHNLAQRYYRAALQLAQEAGDATRHAVILHDMSAQALFLGHHRSAAQLAEAAVKRTSARTPPGTRAALLGQAAVCHAALSDSRPAFRNLAEAEKSLRHPDVQCQPDNRSGVADLEYRTGLVLAFLRHLPRAEAALADSLRHRPEAERRSRMLTIHQLAQVQLRRARPEQACTTWQRFLSDYPYMYSGRINVIFRRFQSGLQEHRNNATVRHVLRQASKLANRSD